MDPYTATYLQSQKSSKINKIWGTLLQKQEKTHKRCSSMDHYTATYLQSQKPSKEHRQDMWGTAREGGMLPAF